MMFRVVREDVPFKINLNVNDYVPTALVVGNELFGGWCEDRKITGEDCDISTLIRDLIGISLYFLKSVHGNRQNDQDYLKNLYKIVNPEPIKSQLEFWYETLREFNVELSEDVLAYYVSSLGFYYAEAVFLLRKPESCDDYEVVMIFKSHDTGSCPEWIKKRKEGEIVRVTMTLKDFVTEVIKLAEEFLEILEERKKYLSRRILINTQLSEELSPEDESLRVRSVINVAQIKLAALKKFFWTVYQTKEYEV